LLLAPPLFSPFKTKSFTSHNLLCVLGGTPFLGEGGE
jgi:hypothetical protein